jgi:RecJ-like exonuclease
MEQKSSNKKMYWLIAAVVLVLLAVIGNNSSTNEKKWYDNPTCCNCMGKGTVTFFETTTKCKYCSGSGHLSEATYNKKCK